MLKSCAGWALILAGLLVAGHMVVEPLYHATDPEMPVNPVWEAINPVMAAAILLGCGVAWGRKRRGRRRRSGLARLDRGQRPLPRPCGGCAGLLLELVQRAEPGVRRDPPGRGVGGVDGSGRGDAAALHLAGAAADRKGLTQGATPVPAGHAGRRSRKSICFEGIAGPSPDGAEAIASGSAIVGVAAPFRRNDALPDPLPMG